MVKTEIIPVIHMLNQNQVITNINTCIECGIEKVFLINHSVSITELIECAKSMKVIYPNMWIGVNMLGLTPEQSLLRDTGLDGLWCDATVNTTERGFKGMVFGGLAFKYQKQPTDLKLACEESKIYTDVACTSGKGTGIAANFDKIQSIREYLQEHPMAIASGVSEENILDYKGVVDYLLVATSITDKNELIIKEKLKNLKEKL